MTSTTARGTFLTLVRLNLLSVMLGYGRLDYVTFGEIRLLEVN